MANGNGIKVNKTSVYFITVVFVAGMAWGISQIRITWAADEVKTVKNQVDVNTEFITRFDERQKNVLKTLARIEDKLPK